MKIGKSACMQSLGCSGSICTENPHGSMMLKRTVNQAGLRVTLHINVSVMFKMGTQLIT